MRTQEEILARIRAIKNEDWMGTQRNDLINALTFKNAEQFLKDRVTDDEWEPVRTATEKKIKSEAINYMAFAWDKAINCRGISAGRSMDHYTSWLWLLGDNELWRDLGDYTHYGKDNLRKICDYLQIDADQWDDGIRVSNEFELAALEGR